MFDVRGKINTFKLQNTINLFSLGKDKSKPALLQTLGG